jgi:hypothetical protein
MASGLASGIDMAFLSSGISVSIKSLNEPLDQKKILLIYYYNFVDRC